MIKHLWAGLFCLALFFLAACDNNRIYEQNIDIKANNWSIENAKEFSFEITDPSKTYDIYFNVRNALSYEFYNLYVSQTLISPDGQMLDKKLHNMFLMDKKTGEPLGSGAGDIFDHSFLALKKQQFPKAGTYKIKLVQYMRKNPLPGVMSVGVKVAFSETE